MQSIRTKRTRTEEVLNLNDEPAPIQQNSYQRQYEGMRSDQSKSANQYASNRQQFTNDKVRRNPKYNDNISNATYYFNPVPNRAGVKYAYVYESQVEIDENYRKSAEHWHVVKNSLNLDANSYVKKSSNNKFMTLVLEVSAPDDEKLAKDLSLDYGANKVKYAYKKDQCYKRSVNLHLMRLHIINCDNITNDNTRKLIHEKLNLEFIRRKFTATGRALWWAGTPDEEIYKKLINGRRCTINGLNFYFSEWKPRVNKLHFCSNCLLHTSNPSHTTDKCTNDPICPQCAREHTIDQCMNLNSEPICKNCSTMDDHRADSISCPKYRETMNITQERYEQMLRERNLNKANPDNIEQNMNEIWNLTKQNSNDIKLLAESIEKHLTISTKQVIELTDLVSKTVSFNQTSDANKFIENADKVLNGQLYSYLKNPENFSVKTNMTYASINY